MRYLVVGDCTIDVLIRPLESDSKRLCKPAEIKVTPGGVGRNVSMHLASFDNEVLLLSALQSEWQKLLFLQQAKIDKYKIKFFDSTSGSVFCGFIDKDGDIDNGYYDSRAVESIRHEDVIEQVVEFRPDMVVIDANVSASVARKVANYCNGTSIPYALEAVSVPKARRLLSSISGCSLVKCNQYELAELLGSKPAEVAANYEAALASTLTLGTKSILSSLGDKGCSYADGTVMLHKDTVARKINNTNGAGDAMFAKFIHDINSQLVVEQALKNANEYAARVCSATLEEE